MSPLLYAELKVLAAGAMRGERGDHTLQTTALVNEACLRVLGQRSFVRPIARNSSASRRK